jgi:lipoate-protein ligase A
MFGFQIGTDYIATSNDTNSSAMKFLDLTLPTPAENLALDEALLDLCERDGGDGILRFWEAREHFIVLGYSNKAATEARLERARQDGIPVLRRCTGGGAVLQGPGCLNYSLILPITAEVTETNRQIMQRHAAALGAEVRGHSDLTIGDRKFSGNAQRRKRRYLLFHGSFLQNLDIERVERLLPMPSREPDYRQKRPHRQFLRNVTLPYRQSLRQCWRAEEPLTDLPDIAALVRQYTSEEWTFKF